MIAPHTSIQDDPTQELLIAMRALFSRNPCATGFGAETISELLHKEHYLSFPVAGYEVEGAVEALRVEGEVLG